MPWCFPWVSRSTLASTCRITVDGGYHGLIKGQLERGKTSTTTSKRRLSTCYLPSASQNVRAAALSLTLEDDRGMEYQRRLSKEANELRRIRGMTQQRLGGMWPMDPPGTQGTVWVSTESHTSPVKKRSSACCAALSPLRSTAQTRQYGEDICQTPSKTSGAQCLGNCAQARLTA